MSELALKDRVTQALTAAAPAPGLDPAGVEVVAATDGIASVRLRRLPGVDPDGPHRAGGGTAPARPGGGVPGSRA